MGAFDRSYHGILNRYQQIKEQSNPPGMSNPQGPMGQEFLKRVADLKKKYPNATNWGLDDPELGKEFADLWNWYDQNREQIVGPSGSAPVNAGTASKTAGTAPTAKSAPLSQSASTKPSTGTDASQSAQPTGEISQQQKDLFKKLHGTSYNPNSSMDKAKMGQLQSAGAEVGYDDVGKLANSAYAKQYAGTPKGDAYAKKAETATTSTPTQAMVNEPSQDFSLTSSQPIKMNLSSPVGLAANTSSTGSSSVGSPITPSSTSASKTPTSTNTPPPKASKAPLSNKKTRSRK